MRGITEENDVTISRTKQAPKILGPTFSLMHPDRIFQHSAV